MNENEKLNEIVNFINNAWINEEIDSARKYFDPEVVFTGPDPAQSLKGIDTCLGTYSDFNEKVKVEDFTSNDKAITVNRDSGIVYYNFEIEYELAGELYKETGNEILVFKKFEDGWKIIWRAIASSN